MSWPKRIAKRIYSAIPFKRELFTALRAVVKVPEPIYRHLHFKGAFTVRVDKDRAFRMMHHGYLIENELFWRGLEGWEKISLELWKRLSERSQVILDIGANTGIYSLVASTVNPDATIVAAEPVARVYEKLTRNVALNEHGIVTLRAAISDRSGTAVLYDQAESEHVLSVSLDPDWNKESPALRPVEVPCMTVMGMLEQVDARTADLIKIDVETHEPAVLRGFLEMLRRDKPSLMIELLTEDVVRQVAEMLDGLGYEYYNIDDVTWPPPRVDVLSRSDHYNFLVCQPEVARSIGL